LISILLPLERLALIEKTIGAINEESKFVRLEQRFIDDDVGRSLGVYFIAQHREQRTSMARKVHLFQ
jgi:hypothetical protein